MTTNGKTARVAALCVAVPLCFASPVSAAEGEGWDWIVTPYVWAVVSSLTRCPTRKT